MRDDAVVVGGSIAGLLGAAALAGRFDHVTVFERKPCPEPGASLAPQGRMPHVLLLGGVEAIESLLPGFVEDLAAAGAVMVGSREGRWWNGGYRAAFDDPTLAPFATRVLVEQVIRARVGRLPNVDLRYGTDVGGLVGDSTTIRGLDVDGAPITAELVVDASGRNSHLDRWLEAIGAPVPTVDEVKVDVAYAGTIVEGPDLPTKYLVCQSMFPDNPRIGLALAVEHGRWAVLMGGYHGDRPPTDVEGFRAFARSLAMDELGDLVDLLEPDDILSYRFSSNRRRRYERLDLPSGLVPIGDTLCSFNPVYGQGMSVAAQEALLLQQAATSNGLDTRRVVRRMAKIVDGPWRIAADADLGHPQTEGHRPPNPVDRWILRVLAATTVDPAVARAMMRVTSLQDPPSALFRPGVVRKVVQATRGTGGRTRSSAAA